jgi:hypothetical protein
VPIPIISILMSAYGGVGGGIVDNSIYSNSKRQRMEENKIIK